jgi:transaldolase
MNGIKIFADGSNIKEIFDLYENNEIVQGFTTNPSLMRKAGVTDYKKFIKEVCSKITDLPISFEVFADEPEQMLNQAFTISEFGQNIYIKIPITNTKGIYTFDVISKLIEKNIPVNITAVFTFEQINDLKTILPQNKNNIVSIFAGRISDTGRDPLPYIKHGLIVLSQQCEILWASTRHVYNIYEAKAIGCEIITVTPDQIKKLSLFNKDLKQYSLETVKMFFDDATTSGLTL